MRGFGNGKSAVGAGRLRAGGLRLARQREPARGVVAALLSGVAFYLVSGMWTSPPRGGPDYPRFFLNWTFAFFPGFLALFWTGQDAPKR